MIQNYSRFWRLLPRPILHPSTNFHYNPVSSFSVTPLTEITTWTLDMERRPSVEPSLPSLVIHVDVIDIFFFSIFIATRLREWKIMMWLRVMNAALPDTAHVIPMLQHRTLDWTACFIRAETLSLKKVSRWRSTSSENIYRLFWRAQFSPCGLKYDWIFCKRQEEDAHFKLKDFIAGVWESGSTADEERKHQGRILPLIHHQTDMRSINLPLLCVTPRARNNRWDVNWMVCESGTIQWATVRLGFTPSWWCNDAVVSSAAHPRHTLHFFLCKNLFSHVSLMKPLKSQTNSVFMFEAMIRHTRHR